MKKDLNICKFSRLKTKRHAELVSASIQPDILLTAVSARSRNKFGMTRGFERISKTNPSPPKTGAKKAFSIAEAMIVMLIVSIAMAAMAPIISKRTLRGDSGECEWILTTNGADIARPNSNVRIGGGGATNPAARLDVQMSASGIAQKITVVAAQAPANILEIHKTGATNPIAGIDSSGNYFPSTAIPAGMVGTFSLAACPSGWSAYAAGNQRFPFMTTNGGEVGGTAANNILSHYHGVGTKMDKDLFVIQRGWPITSSTFFTGDSGDSWDKFGSDTAGTGLYSTTDAFVSTAGATLNPAHVKLLACVKN